MPRNDNGTTWKLRINIMLAAAASPHSRGSLIRAASLGTPTMAPTTTANFARSGSARTCDLIASIKPITLTPRVASAKAGPNFCTGRIFQAILL